MATAKFEKLKIEIRVVPNPHSVNLIDMFITKAYPYLFETQECYILYNYGFDSVNPWKLPPGRLTALLKKHISVMNVTKTDSSLSKKLLTVSVS